MKYLKMSAQIIAPILTELYNNCIKARSYPEILKSGHTVPTHKSGAKDQCSNYRPTSLLSPLSKLFEKCLYENCMHILINLTCLHCTNMVLDKIVQHRTQLGNYTITFWIILTQRKLHVLCFWI